MATIVFAVIAAPTATSHTIGGHEVRNQELIGVLMVSRGGVAVDDRDRLVVELYRAGVTGPGIASALGCTPTTVYRRLDRQGISRPARRSRRPDRDELRRLYIDDGLSQRQIARGYGVTPQAVALWLTASNIARRSPTQGRADGDTIEHLYVEQRCSALTIAAQLECSTATVYRALKRRAIPRRDHPALLNRLMLIDALADGLSAPQIADLYGVAVTNVCRALTRNGLRTARQARRQQAGQRLRNLIDAPAAATSD